MKSHMMVHEKQGPVCDKVATVKGTGRMGKGKGKKMRKRGSK